MKHGTVVDSNSARFGVLCQTKFLLYVYKAPQSIPFWGTERVCHFGDILGGIYKPQGKWQINIPPPLQFDCGLEEVSNFIWRHEKLRTLYVT